MGMVVIVLVVMGMRLTRQKWTEAIPIHSALTNGATLHESSDIDKLRPTFFVDYTERNMFKTYYDYLSDDACVTNDSWRKMNWDELGAMLETHSSNLYTCCSSINNIDDDFTIPDYINYDNSDFFAPSAHIRLAYLLRLSILYNTWNGENERALREFYVIFRLYKLWMDQTSSCRYISSIGLLTMREIAVSQNAAIDDLKEMLEIIKNCNLSMTNVRNQIIETFKFVIDWTDENDRSVWIERLSKTELYVCDFFDPVHNSRMNIRYAFSWFLNIFDTYKEPGRYSQLEKFITAISLRSPSVWFYYKYRDPIGLYTSAVWVNIAMNTYVEGLFDKYDLEATKAIIAVCIYKKLNGVYPDSLSDLVPDILETVPRDPIDGETLRYRKTENDSWLIYSVWLNNVDDGGTCLIRGRCPNIINSLDVAYSESLFKHMAMTRSNRFDFGRADDEMTPTCR